MKKMLICIALLSMIGGKCFSQGDNPDHFYVPDDLWETFMKGERLGAEGKWSEAFPYFKLVADKGNVAYAQHEVSVCYQNGDGIPVNLTEAFKYLYRAATNIKPWGPSFKALGDYYRIGIGTSKNLTEAFKWYRKGAEPPSFVITSDEDIAECMFRVGLAFALGEGIKQDNQQAIFWLAEADKKGHVHASGILAFAYLNGDPFPKDEVEGVKWLRRSAELGNAVSQYGMGMSYSVGTGNTPIDKIKALEWLKKAAANGYTKALDEIRELEK